MRVCLVPGRGAYIVWLALTPVSPPTTFSSPRRATADIVEKTNQGVVVTGLFNGNVTFGSGTDSVFLSNLPATTGHGFDCFLVSFDELGARMVAMAHACGRCVCRCTTPL